MRILGAIGTLYLASVGPEKWRIFCTRLPPDKYREAIGTAKNRPDGSQV